MALFKTKHTENDDKVEIVEATLTKKIQKRSKIEANLERMDQENF